jgi:hypothetical protein
MTMAGGGNGELSFVVWPTHAGAVNAAGEEPMFGVEYKRGQITWELNEQGTLCGRTRIEVPAGEWCWIIYCHNPLYPGFVTAKKLVHPLVLQEPGVIDLMDITEDEVKPLAPDPVLRD